MFDTAAPFTVFLRFSSSRLFPHRESDLLQFSVHSLARSRGRSGGHGGGGVLGAGGGGWAETVVEERKRRAYGVVMDFGKAPYWAGTGQGKGVLGTLSEAPVGRPYCMRRL